MLPAWIERKLIRITFYICQDDGQSETLSR